MVRVGAVVVLAAGVLAAVAPTAVSAQEPGDGLGVAGLQRVEVAEAGVALSVPLDWSFEITMRTDDSGLPQGVTPEDGARATEVLTAVQGTDVLWCALWWFEGMPITIHEHADTIASGPSDDLEATVETSIVPLPAGEADRIVYRSGDGESISEWYMLGPGADHYKLMCLDISPFEDDLLAIAESIELLAVESPDPADAPRASGVVSAQAVSGFSSVVDVGDGLLMHADCEVVVWVEFTDGIGREWFSCRLSDTPVDDPELQGARPDELTTVSGAACEWFSDLWSVTDGSEVWALSYELTVTPDGRVFGSATYPAEPLQCSSG